MDVHPDGAHYREAHEVLNVLEAGGRVDEVASRLSLSQLEGGPRGQRIPRTAEIIVAWWSTQARDSWPSVVASSAVTGSAPLCGRTPVGSTVSATPRR